MIINLDKLRKLFKYSIFSFFLEEFIYIKRREKELIFYFDLFLLE